MSRWDFDSATVDGRAVLVESDGVYDVERASNGRLGPDARAAVADTSLLRDLAGRLADREPDHVLGDVTLGPPLPNPTHVFGIGLNYRGHAAETGAALPEAPLVFAKFAGCLTGPDTDCGDRVRHDRLRSRAGGGVGVTGRNIAAADAWGAVAGLTIGQDLSDRELQNAGERPQFSLAKSHDGYGPTGPLIVSPDLLDDPDALDIECYVNGERRQSDNTRNLIFTVPALVEYLSRMMTLHAGDIIFTGTPSGVGLATGQLPARG